ncbi:hypothetical protein HHK36_021238 [Tetracentron sinense]|uniref:Uncharacterized protein n=1 Tax=Tetracentron sinense TaxID=13715 RepID=A0A834YR49_TETSI|nr:hypothetical protein HHK36_021238 [Tetracentron sinense]
MQNSMKRPLFLISLFIFLGVSGIISQARTFPESPCNGLMVIKDYEKPSRPPPPAPTAPPNHPTTCLTNPLSQASSPARINPYLVTS